MSKFLKLLLWMFLVLLIGLFVGMQFQPVSDTWYQSLAKSPLTPPGYVFGVVWPILYIMIGASGYHTFSEDTPSWVKGLFLFQLLLNYLWTPVFFYYQFVGLGVVILLLLAFILSVLVGWLYHLCKVASFLLIPYTVWIYFATYLNLVIWWGL